MESISNSFQFQLGDIKQWKFIKQFEVERRKQEKKPESRQKQQTGEKLSLKYWVASLKK